MTGDSRLSKDNFAVAKNPFGPSDGDESRKKSFACVLGTHLHHRADLPPSPVVDAVGAELALFCILAGRAANGHLLARRVRSGARDPWPAGKNHLGFGRISGPFFFPPAVNLRA